MSLASEQPDVTKLPLRERALRALREGVKDAIAEHIRTGVPMYVWRDDRIVEISPEELKKIA